MYVCICMYVCMCMYLCMYVCICMYVCMCMCVCVCIHVYVCMHNILGNCPGGNVLPKTGRGNCPGGIVQGGIVVHPWLRYGNTFHQRRLSVSRKICLSVIIHP